MCHSKANAPANSNMGRKAVSSSVGSMFCVKAPDIIEDEQQNLDSMC